VKSVGKYFVHGGILFDAHHVENIEAGEMD
jgi:hypothetical protein